MKRFVLIGFAASALLASLPSAAQAQATARDQESSAAPNAKTFDRLMGEAQAQMHRMQEQMNRLRETQDPQKRQALMHQHLTAMQNAMTAMRGMWGPGTMGCCGVVARTMHGPGMMGGGHLMGWGNMHGYYSNLTPEQTRQGEYMMDQYLGLQQTMMDHMMQRLEWMFAPNGPTK